MGKVKTGIIGTGFIGPAHVEAVRRLGYVEVAAVAEANKDLAEQKAAALSIPKAYGSYQELLADPEIQVVHVCTPNTLHYPIVKDALQAGKHVYCEKPLAMNSRESAELVKMADDLGLVNAVNFNYRFYPLNQEAKAKVQSGEIGRTLVITGSYLQDWLLLPTDYNWRIEPDLGGESRAVADIGSHWCDLISFITGQKFTRVYADLAVVHKTRMKPKKAIETYAGKELTPEDYEAVPVTTEDYGTVMFEMDGGARGVFTVCQVCAGRKNRLYYEIDCEKAALAYDQEDVERLWIGRRDGPNQVLMRDPSILSSHAKQYTSYPGGHPEGYPDGLKNFMSSFYGFVISDKDPRKEKPDFPTFIDGHAEIAIVEAVLTSAKKQAWTEVIY
ncbi:MAG TPA: Gfo/Idh/MocA family oxidoreductase [Armatimonadota bacterium]|nr:Gfo/Idh/MocA family oxidoreductase [Armatimonadota bacterium]HPP74839.1 Gfo/Idh/MocA family oxidoreductase [Armatimonadota bacterium]